MRITGVTQHHVEGSLDGAYNPTWIPGYPQGANEAELFEIETDEGIVGWAGSPSFAGGLEYEDQLSLPLTGQESDPHDLTRRDGASSGDVRPHRSASLASGDGYVGHHRKGRR
ncbi:MAG: hypothetical protein U5J64_00660 [Halobacteriales archaeon]|nr:hypothetical protein [Halobacteriales archaeon]